MSSGAGRRRRRDEEESESARDYSESLDRQPDSEESGEDLMGDNMVDDYREVGVLDTYDSALLDDRDYAPMDYDARRRAEEAMMARDRTTHRRDAGRLGAAFSEDDASSEAIGFRETRRRRRDAEESDPRSDAPSDVDYGDELDIDTSMHLRELIQQEQARAWIRQRFKLFLDTYTIENSDTTVYEKIIDDMCAANKQSLPVSYMQLSHFQPRLAIWLADMPRPILALFDEVARQVVRERYPNYWMIHEDIYVRIHHLPIPDSLRDLRHVHLNVLIKVSGVVTKRTGVFPQLKVARYTCTKCNTVSAPVPINDNAKELRGTVCLQCQSEGPFILNSEQTVFRNYQKITLQESPGSVPPGRVPRSKDVILVGDLIDSARPGEEVEVTGIYTHSYDAGLNSRQGFPVFSTIIEANNITKQQNGLAHLVITEQDHKEIQELAQDPAIVKRLIKSIAPSIYGNYHVKEAVALAMFGGREKNINQKHKIRGDINVLLLGDPGTAKSQVLKYVEKTAPRCVYTTGKGASAVGLTAAVHKDPVTGEWVLEGGALVLSDRGVCCIDEFDKMGEQDRTSIHEAMEQQSISISKAGIVTTLQARCSVIAAANPIGGRYDPVKTFSENVQLTDPILTRFDILCVLKDEPDYIRDSRLAEHVFLSHARSHPVVKAAVETVRIRDTRKKDLDTATSISDARASSQLHPSSDNSTRETSERSSQPILSALGHSLQEAEEAVAHIPRDLLDLVDALNRPAVPIEDDLEGDAEVIPQDLLRKYIHVAKSIKPSLSSVDQEKVSRLYSELRREAEISNGIPIAVRHIESIMRIAEAAARMRLSPVVSDSDLTTAIRVMLESFITAQKIGVQTQLRTQFYKYLRQDTNLSVILMYKLRDLLRERVAYEHAVRGVRNIDETEQIEIKLGDFLNRVSRQGITNVNEFLYSSAFRNANFVYNPQRKVIVYMPTGDPISFRASS